MTEVTGDGRHPVATAVGGTDGPTAAARPGDGPLKAASPVRVLGGAPPDLPSSEGDDAPDAARMTVVGRPSQENVLDASPVTVLTAPSSGGAVPSTGASAAASRKARGAADRRRKGVALLTAAGVVVLAGVPFAVVAPKTRILSDSAASPATRPHNEAGKRAGERPAVPVPVPTWQPRHPSAPPPARPPAVSLPPTFPSAAGPKKDEPVRPPWRRAGGRPPAGPHVPPPKGKAGPRTEAVHVASGSSPSRKASAKAAASSRSTTGPSRAASHWQTRYVHGTTVLRPGGQIRTNRLRLILQKNGDLVLRDQGKVVWSTGTHASGTHAVFQADGNFVLYGKDDRTLWSTRTDGHDGATLVLQNDGNLTIVQGGTTLWASHTAR